MTDKRKLRMALIGGGGAGFIGKVHVTAATLDRRAELVAGAFSSDASRSKLAAVDFGVQDERAYGSYRELLDRESALPPEQRVDFVSIATPNHTHFEIAKAALESGFHVVCDKPMTLQLEQALELQSLVKESGRVFALSHNYSGYPLVRQAKDMIASGEIGDVQAIRVHYLQGWMQTLDPEITPKRGAWKADPSKAGSGSLGDIGTHAYHLARFITGLEPVQLSSRLFSLRDDWQLDDYGHVLVKMENDAVAMITYSQMTHGRLNDLSIDIDGSAGSLSWRQEEPNILELRRQGQPVQLYQRNPAFEYTSANAAAACRLPGGHPEAFFEAFANVYRNAFDAMQSGNADGTERLYPTVDDGVDGVRFIQQCLASSKADAAWMPMK